MKEVPFTSTYIHMYMYALMCFVRYNTQRGTPVHKRSLQSLVSSRLGGGSALLSFVLFYEKEVLLILHFFRFIPYTK